MMLSLFQYEFMQRAFAVGIMIAVISPLIGTFVVLRRFSMIGETCPMLPCRYSGLYVGGIYPMGSSYFL